MSTQETTNGTDATTDTQKDTKTQTRRKGPNQRRKKRVPTRVYATQSAPILVRADETYPEGYFGRYKLKPEDTRPEGMPASMVGRYFVVRFESRRILKAEQRWNFRLRWSNGILIGEMPDGQPGPDVRTHVQITKAADLPETGAVDKSGRKIFRYAAMGILAYQDQSLSLEEDPVAATNPVFLVFTKGASGILTRDRDFIDLLSEMVEEDGRIPDLSLLRSRGLAMKIMNRQSIRLGKPAPTPTDPHKRAWLETVSIETLLGLSCALPSLEELETRYTAWITQLDADWNEQVLQELVAQEAIRPEEVSQFQEAREHNRKKAHQGYRLMRKRVERHLESEAVRRAQAEADLIRMVEAQQHGGVLIAPPSASAALGAGDPERELTYPEMEEAWRKAMASFAQASSFEDRSIERWGQLLVSAAIPLGMPTPAELDDDLLVVMQLLNDVQFPDSVEARRAFIVHIRATYQSDRYTAEQVAEMADIKLPSLGSEEDDQSAPNLSDLSETWEKWLGTHKMKKALTSTLAATEMTPEALAATSVEERDELLAGLAERDRAKLERALSKKA